MLKKLYDRCLYYASHKLSKIFLAIVSFIESSFFPIPPDVMIVPMVVAKKEDFLKIFYISTFFSVMGGVLGYFIGYYFLEFSVSIIELYGYEDKVLELQNKIVQTLEQTFESIDLAEANVEKKLEKLKELKNSVLQKAFTEGLTSKNDLA